MYTLLNLSLLYSSNVNVVPAGDLWLDISILNKIKNRNRAKNEV